jgi:hypothetical protein
MTAHTLISEGEVLRAGRARGRRAEIRRRLLFSTLVAAHALACRLIQDKVLAGSGVFDYMGLHWFAAPMLQELVFFALAIVPAATFIPMRLARPGDLLLIIVYTGVFVPATALFPNVTETGLWDSLLFTLVSMAGLYAATVLSRMKITGAGLRWGMQAGNFDLLLYAAAGLVITAYLAFVPVLVLELDVTRVYEFRANFTDQQAKMSPLLLYAFVNSALALSPIMIVRGLLLRKWLMVVVAFALAYYTFVVTSYRSLLFVSAFVAALTFLMRLRVPIGVSIVALFVVVAIAVVAIDAIGRDPIPTQTFALHYRLFGNAATITSGYLGVFSHYPKFYFSQSFLHFLITPPTDTPYPLLVGAQITDVPGDWANGNILADAFANLGLVGILAICAALGLILALYNHLSLAKDRTVAALALGAPAFYLNNGGLQSAVLSGGLAVLILLIVLYPTLDPAPQAQDFSVSDDMAPGPPARLVQGDPEDLQPATIDHKAK